MRALALLIVLLTPASSLAQEAACTIHEPDFGLEEVVVRPRGEPHFSVTVSGADIRVRPDRRAHHVAVRAGIAFEGVSESPRFSLRRPVETGFGQVRLSTSATLSQVRSRGAGTSVVAHPVPWLSIAGLRVPCDALSLGFAPDSPLGGAEPAGDGTQWAPRTRNVVLRNRPGAGPGVRLRVIAPGLLRLVRLERRGEHFRVFWGSGDGSTIQGWVARASVRPHSPHVWGSTGGSGGMVACGRGGRGEGPGFYQGPARVRPGAPVFTRADGARWATIEEAEVSMVHHWSGGDWVELARVRGVVNRGLCEAITHAWVRLEDVALPAGAHAP